MLLLTHGWKARAMRPFGSEQPCFCSLRILAIHAQASLVPRRGMTGHLAYILCCRFGRSFDLLRPTCVSARKLRFLVARAGRNALVTKRGAHYERRKLITIHRSEPTAVMLIRSGCTALTSTRGSEPRSSRTISVTSPRPLGAAAYCQPGNEGQDEIALSGSREG